MKNEKRILVAMSGGVDSSAVLKIIKDEGYDCAGAMMKLLDEKNMSGIIDAKSVAEKLKVPFYLFDFRDDFQKYVINKFVSTYLNGSTPNPCVDCNKHLKFGKFYTKAKELGYNYIATGHYVRKKYDEQNKRWQLLRAEDRTKDQSYVLYSITQEQLEHTVFPTGVLNKTIIRKIASDGGLENADKPDSQDICFIPDGDYVKYITDVSGNQDEGDIILTDGTIMGKHKGLINYTIGQRKGIGISYIEPLFVTSKDQKNNVLILGTKDKLSCKELYASDCNYIFEDEPEVPFECTAQTRYHQKEVRCIVYPLDNKKARIEFPDGHNSVSTGQAIVFYNGDIVLGGGTVTKVK